MSSEYFRLAVRDATAARDELHGLGLEDGEDDEGGMVTGKSNMDIIARRNHDRAAKKKLRRDRQAEAQRQAEAEDDDSSDLSDSDDEGESLRRFVTRPLACGGFHVLTRFQVYGSDRFSQGARQPGSSRLVSYSVNGTA